MNKPDKRLKPEKGESMWIPAPLVAEVKTLVNQWRITELQAQLKALNDGQPVTTQPEPVTLPTLANNTSTKAEYLTPTPETPITGFKQVEWVEPVPIQATNGYDGTTKLQGALERLYNKKLSSNQNAALTNEAVTALGIDRGVDSAGRPSLIKDAPTRTRIYQWHVDNGGNAPKTYRG